MKKEITVKIFRPYFFELFKREIKIPYEVKEGKIIFEQIPKKTDQVIISYEYKEE